MQVSKYKTSEAVHHAPFYKQEIVHTLCLYIAGLSSHTSLYGRKLHDIHSPNKNMVIV